MKVDILAVILVFGTLGIWSYFDGLPPILVALLFGGGCLWFLFMVISLHRLWPRRR